MRQPKASGSSGSRPRSINSEHRRGLTMSTHGISSSKPRRRVTWRASIALGNVGETIWIGTCSQALSMRLFHMVDVLLAYISLGNLSCTRRLWKRFSTSKPLTSAIPLCSQQTALNLINGWKTSYMPIQTSSSGHGVLKPRSRQRQKRS